MASNDRLSPEMRDDLIPVSTFSEITDKLEQARHPLTYLRQNRPTLQTSIQVSSSSDRLRVCRELTDRLHFRMCSSSSSMCHRLQQHARLIASWLRTQTSKHNVASSRSNGNARPLTCRSRCTRQVYRFGDIHTNL